MMLDGGRSCNNNTHLDRSSQAEPRRRVLHAFDQVPYASTHGTHTKCAPYIIDNAIRTWLSLVFYYARLLWWVRHWWWLPRLEKGKTATSVHAQYADTSTLEGRRATMLVCR